MEYYLNKKDYINTFELYKQLTEEIGRSDCTRYYHARQKYYNKMLQDMSIYYPELKFFEDIGYYKFKLLHNSDDIKIGQEITLEKEDYLMLDLMYIKMMIKS